MVMTETTTSPPVPGWLRCAAWLTVLVALPLVLLGAETTTKGVGMADTTSLRTPWYFFTLNLRETSLGLLIEHSHRLFGWAVGLCCIVLALGLQTSARGGYRQLGWLALAAVVAQGVFGILRVKWNALAGAELAAFHGCFGQLTFATLVAVAVMVSRHWTTTPAVQGGGLGRMAAGLGAVVFLQIVFGAVLRHHRDPLAQRVHVLLAFIVLLGFFWLYARLRDADADAVTIRVAHLLATILLIQPILGVEAWIGRFGAGTLPELVPSSPLLDLVRSGHHLLGTLIFATTVALAVLLRRPSSLISSEYPPMTAGRSMEGVA